MVVKYWLTSYHSRVVIHLMISFTLSINISHDLRVPVLAVSHIFTATYIFPYFNLSTVELDLILTV